MHAFAPAGVAEQAAFLRWLSSKLQGDMYPGSPFERKYFAALLLNHLLDVWCQGQPVGGKNQMEHLSLRPASVSLKCSRLTSLVLTPVLPLLVGKLPAFTFAVSNLIAKTPIFVALMHCRMSNRRQSLQALKFASTSTESIAEITDRLRKAAALNSAFLTLHKNAYIVQEV